MKAIYKKEFSSYFNNMLGYVLVAFMLVMIGIFTMGVNLTGGYPNFEYALANTTMVLLIIIPVLTMRSLAEEKRSKTDQLLLTTPVSITRIILGKYFAMLSVFAVPVLICAVYPLILGQYGTVNYLVTYTSIFAYLLMGAALIAIGMFMSSLTESQVISAVISFGVMILAYFAPLLQSLVASSARASFFAFTLVLIGLIALLYVMSRNFILSAVTGVVLETALIILYMSSPQVLENSFSKVIGIFAVFDRFDVFLNGMFDVANVFYYLSVTALFIFLSIQSLEKRRWS